MAAQIVVFIMSPAESWIIVLAKSTPPAVPNCISLIFIINQFKNQKAAGEPAALIKIRESIFQGWYYFREDRSR